jgi:hypothetical protein
MGSEIPMSVPLDVLWVCCAIFTDGGRLFFRLLMRNIASSARTAPKAAPGKKPAMIAFVGKEGHALAIAAAVPWQLEAALEADGSAGSDAVMMVGWTPLVEDAVSVTFEDAVAVVGAVDVVDVVDSVEAVVEAEGGSVVLVSEDTELVAVEVDVFMAQMLLLWQLYPKGQHESPHFGRVSPSRIVLTTAFGWRVEFCCDTSQVIGSIKAQLCPLGQQMAELPLSRLTQVDVDGQQKDDGRLELLHCSYDAGQESEARFSRLLKA